MAARIRSLMVLCCCAAAIISLQGCPERSGNKSAPKQADVTAPTAPRRVMMHSGSLRGDTVIRLPSKEDLSVIFIVLSPEIDIIVTGPGGRRTGKANATGTILTEIPYSDYSSEYIEDPQGEAGMESKQLSVRMPDDGEYLISVFNAGQGNYNLSIGLHDFKANHLKWDFKNVSADKDSVCNYRIVFRKGNVNDCKVLKEPKAE